MSLGCGLESSLIDDQFHVKYYCKYCKGVEYECYCQEAWGFGPCACIEADGEALITVRGKERYVVMTMAKYNDLREAELVQAVRETRADYEAGRIDDRSIDDHMRRLNDDV